MHLGLWGCARELSEDSWGGWREEASVRPRSMYIHRCEYFDGQSIGKLEYVPRIPHRQGNDERYAHLKESDDAQRGSEKLAAYAYDGK